MLTRVAALELGRSGVRVNGVAPGVVDTPLVAPAMQTRGRCRDARPYAAGAADRSAGRDRRWVVFLASRSARWITGEIITVDGGQRLLGEPDVAVLAGAVAADG